MTVAGAVLLVQLAVALPAQYDLADSASASASGLASVEAAADPAPGLAALPPATAVLAPIVSPPALTPPLVSVPILKPVVRILEPPPISRHERIAWTSLSFGTHAAAVFDARTTRIILCRYGGKELNPFYRPVAGSDAGLFTLTQVTAGGANYIGWRMLHSERRWLRKLWWLPQTLSFAGSLFGGLHNLSQIHQLQNSTPH